tara:strand:+ start:136 stop:672 length:537 start_codon:yes stop_codon:yes gene_type:complete
MIRKLWKDPVWSAVIAASIVAGATYLLGYWSNIWQFVKSIPSLLTTPVSTPLWGFLIGVPVLLLTMPFLTSLKAKKEPRFLSYRSDTIFDITWSWRWIPPSFHSNHYQIKALTPRCPSCGAVLTINDYDGSLVSCINENCSWLWERQHRCGSRISHSSELDSKVRNEIDRRVHAGERG